MARAAIFLRELRHKKNFMTSQAKCAIYFSSGSGSPERGSQAETARRFVRPTALWR